MNNVGDEILVQADEILGTPECQATIVELCDFGYMVRCHDDPSGWVGPVDFNGNVVQIDYRNPYRNIED